jgi:hypothetical protein
MGEAIHLPSAVRAGLAFSGEADPPTRQIKLSGKLSASPTDYLLLFAIPISATESGAAVESEPVSVSESVAVYL